LGDETGGYGKAIVAKRYVDVQGKGEDISSIA
jgi:hypothetical protein